MKNARRVWNKRRSRRKRPPHESVPALQFSPYAWAKLQFLRDAGETEVGGFAITAADDLLRIEDLQLIRQTCTVMTVELSDTAVADYFDQQIDAGRRPEQCGRIWVHTHPGESAQPSSTDEATFARCFGSCQWAVMFILARGGQTYARLRLNVGPGASLLLPVEVDFGHAFGAADPDAWSREYFACVQVAPNWQGRTVVDRREFLRDRELSDYRAIESAWNDDFVDLERLLHECDRESV